MASRQKTSVTYLPNGRIGAVAFPLLFIGAFALSAWAAMISLSSVHLGCSRAAGTCAIVSAFGPFATTRAVPLASIHSARLDSSRTKNSWSYEVVLVTAEGEVSLSRFRSHDKAQRTWIKEQIERFLASTDATFDIEYDEPQLSGLVLVAFGLVWLLAGWAISHFARVEIDPVARTLDVVMLRWPAPPKRHTYPLDAVHAAVVVESSGRKGKTFSVGLVVDGNEKPVPLVGGSSSGRGPKDRTVQALQALLQQQRGS